MPEIAGSTSEKGYAGLGSPKGTVQGKKVVAASEPPSPRRNSLRREVSRNMMMEEQGYFTGEAFGAPILRQLSASFAPGLLRCRVGVLLPDLHLPSGQRQCMRAQADSDP